MPFDTHLKRGHPIVLGLLAFFSFVLMIQSAVLVSSYNRHNDYPSSSLKDRVRFLLFASLWTLAVSIVYIVGFLKAANSFLFSIASHAATFFITWLFWLAGAAAFTQAIGGSIDCDAYRGAHCNQLNAAMAFGWICFILSTFAFLAFVFVGARSARSGNGFGAGLIA